MTLNEAIDWNAYLKAGRYHFRTWELDLQAAPWEQMPKSDYRTVPGKPHCPASPSLLSANPRASASATTLPTCACIPHAWIRVPREYGCQLPLFTGQHPVRILRRQGKGVFRLLSRVVGTQAENSQTWSKMPNRSWKPKIRAHSVPWAIYPLLDFGK